MAIDIKVRSKKFNCDISLEHKITILIGDSGVGKTQFVKSLTDNSKSYNVSISENLAVYKLSKEAWFYILDGIEKDSKKSILIVDDEDFVFSTEFAKKFTFNKTSYLIIIGRTSIWQEKLNNWNGLPVSINAVKQFIGNGKEHYIETSTRYSTVSENDYKIDICLCEDKKSGFIFFSNIFKKVYSADSKDKMLLYIRANKDLFINKSLYLCIDCAASGLLLKDISSLLSMLNCKLSFCSKYESFEYLLLRSNFFKISDEEINKDIIKYLSLERRCTALLEELTKDSIYKYSKSNLSECFYKNCCMKNRQRINCNKGLKGDKIESLLIGTDFEFLLKIRQV